MTRPGEARSERDSPVDDDLVTNLDALSRDLTDIESLADAALTGEPVDQTVLERIANTPGGLDHAELTDHHRQRRVAEGWSETQLADLLDPGALSQLDGWRTAQRIPWERTDLLVVGLAGTLGAVATIFDSQVDTAVLQGLSWLKTSELLRGWERDAARLSIDYTGPKFGGPAHRLRSPGHDIGRFFTALQQVRTGTFEGTWWEDGQRMIERVSTTRSGAPFARAPDPHLAIALLLKHWAADFVTPMGLPLPGWSLLYELPDRELRKFAHAAYAGTKPGDGLNLRSGALTPGLGMVATEVIVRTHAQLSGYRSTGNARLSAAGVARRTEMLLAAHAAAGAVSVSRTAAAAVGGETAFAIRHLNLPVLLRIGMLALQVRADRARAVDGAPSWQELLADEAATWTLPEAVTIAELLDAQRS